MAELESDLGDLQVEGNVLNQLRVKNLRSTRGSEEGRGCRCNLVWDTGPGSGRGGPAGTGQR